MNNTESKYNGLNNAVSNRRRRRPLLDHRPSATDHDKASELGGAGENYVEKKKHCPSKEQPQEQQVSTKDSELKTCIPSKDVLAKNLLSAEEHEQEIDAARQAARDAIGYFCRDKTAKTKTSQTSSEIPAKKSKQAFINPFRVEELEDSDD
jgi:hypothetical protein